MQQGFIRCAAISIAMTLAFPSLAQTRRSARQGRGALPSRGVGRRDRADNVIPMVFPVLGAVEWTDTFNPEGGNGKRQHHGQDLMAPQMRPLVAAFDGKVIVHRPEGNGKHNRITLAGDNGYVAEYMHMNNDTPGTNDGEGSQDYAFAPGLRTGDRVIAGQLLGWVGNSGNAEGGAHHCHFELYSPEGCVNPTASLREAEHLETPRVSLRNPEIAPSRGMVRLDGVVRTLDGETGMTLDLLATTYSDGRSVSILQPKRLTVSLSDAKPLGAAKQNGMATLKAGALVTLLGRVRSEDGSFVAMSLDFENPTEKPAPKTVARATKRTPKTSKGEASLEGHSDALDSLPPAAVAVPMALRPPRIDPKKPTEPNVEENDFEKRLLELVNAERRKQGLEELKRNPLLCRAAKAHSLDMAEHGFYDHLGSNNSTPAERIEKTGYVALQLRENIGQGISDPAKTLERWLTSEKFHKLNLLDPDVREIGIGFVKQNLKETPVREGYFVTALFAMASAEYSQRSSGR